MSFGAIRLSAVGNAARSVRYVSLLPGSWQWFRTDIGRAGGAVTRQVQREAGPQRAAVTGGHVMTWAPVSGGDTPRRQSDGVSAFWRVPPAWFRFQTPLVNTPPLPVVASALNPAAAVSPFASLCIVYTERMGQVRPAGEGQPLPRLKPHL